MVRITYHIVTLDMNLVSSPELDCGEDKEKAIKYASRFLDYDNISSVTVYKYRDHLYPGEKQGKDLDETLEITRKDKKKD